MGRPTSYTEEVADRLCDEVAVSDYGIEHICEADDFPSARTVYRWLDAQPEFRQKYARAKLWQGQTQSERAVRDALTAKDAQLGRLAYDARRWHASKLAPRDYGDKIAHVGGEPGVDQPVQLGVTIEPSEAYRRLIKGEG